MFIFLCRDLAGQLSLFPGDLVEMVDLIKTSDLMEMVEASVMSEDPSFLLDNWEEGEAVRAVSQWEDETYQVSSSFTLVAILPCSLGRHM